MSFSEYIPYYRRNLRMAMPVMLTQLGGALVGLADSVMVGHFSTTALAAVSFANGIFFTVMVFSMGALMGLTPLVGESYAGGDKGRVRGLSMSGLVYTVLLIILTCAVLLLCYPFMGKMGQEACVVSEAQPYYLARVAGLIPMLVFCYYKQLFEGLGNTLIAMLITTVCNICNILLNYLFIFGHCGLPALGALGAGIASMISCCLMPVLFYVVVQLRKDHHRYLGDFRDFSWHQVRDILFVGIPIGGQTLLETVAFTLSFIMVGWISKEALAAHAISNQIADLTFMLALGIGSATTIEVSHCRGRGDKQAMLMSARASIHLVIVMNAIGAGLMIGLRHYIPMLFSADKSVISITSSLLIYAGVFQFSDGLQCVGAGMLRGIKDVRMPVVFCLIAYILIALPLGYVMMFPAGMGVEGMWVGFIAGLSVAAICFHTRFWMKTRGDYIV